MFDGHDEATARLDVFKARFADLPRERLQEDAWTRSAIRTDGCLVVFNWLTADLPELPPHTHDFDQLALILQGTAEFEVKNERYVVSAGELLYIPAEAPHTVRVIGGEEVLNVDVFAPVREDYVHLADHQPVRNGDAS